MEKRLDQTEPKNWEWETASGSALARCLIELLARKDFITVEEMMEVLSERLSSTGGTKGAVPEPVPDLRGALQHALQINIDLIQRLAAAEFVLTTLLACQDEGTRLLVKEAASKSLESSSSSTDGTSLVVRAAVDDIIDRALSARR